MDGECASVDRGCRSGERVTAQRLVDDRADHSGQRRLHHEIVSLIIGQAKGFCSYGGVSTGPPPLAFYGFHCLLLF